MKYWIYLIFTFLAISSAAAQEYIPNLENESTAVLNDELRKLRDEIVDLSNSVVTSITETVEVPSGVIVMWSGTIATIPSGWYLCDGTNGTPDLRNRFVVCAQQDDSGVAKANLAGGLTQSGGSTTISEAQMPSHTHTLSSVSGDVNLVAVGPGSLRALMDTDTTALTTATGSSISSTAAAVVTVSGATDSKGSGSAYTQPFYALAFIQKA